MNFEDYKNYKKRMLIGIVLVAVVGTISHFVYNLTGQNNFVGLFFPVNETPWEHMKLAFFPMLMFTLIIGSMEEDRSTCRKAALMIGTLAATWFIPVLYYSYSGMLGYRKAWIDISTYYISLMLSVLLMLHIIKRIGDRECPTGIGILKLLLLVQGIAFMIFTYKPLDLGIFKL